MTQIFGPLQRMRETPIPDQKPVSQFLRDFPHPQRIDRNDPRFAEKLVKVSDYGLASRSHYFHANNPPYYEKADGSVEHVYLREGVAQSLVRLNEMIGEVGLELYLFDGWRPTQVQAYFHDVWMPKEIRMREPDLSDEDVMAKVGEYWSVPSDDADKPAPHLTGGAVDLTLRWKDSHEHLWMGSIFDDLSPLAHLTRFEQDFSEMGEFAFSHEEARANRRLLFWLMKEFDFGQNPSEWWHYGQGEWLWARLQGQDAAVYGAAGV